MIFWMWIHYCRLSKDDDLQGESASIANQRDMLEKYCEKQGWEVVAVYQDDGFTGDLSQGLKRLYWFYMQTEMCIFFWEMKT